MNFPSAPLDGDIFESPSKIKYKYNLAKKVWVKVKLNNISTETKDTTEEIQKIWVGTLAQYNNIDTKIDTVLYFIKD